MEVFINKGKKDIEYAFMMNQDANFNSPSHFNNEYSPILYLEFKNPILVILDGDNPTDIILTKIFIKNWFNEHEDEKDLTLDSLELDFVPAYYKRMKELHLLFKKDNCYFLEVKLYFIQNGKMFHVTSSPVVEEITNYCIDRGSFAKGVLAEHENLSAKEQAFYCESTSIRKYGTFKFYPIVYGNFPAKTVFFKEFNGNIKEVALENFLWR